MDWLRLILPLWWRATRSYRWLAAGAIRWVTGQHLKRLKALELENGRLRTVVADQALALVIMRETAGKTD